MPTTSRGLPYPPTDGSSSNNVPVDLKALADAVDAMPGVAVLTLAQRNALLAWAKWDGRVIFNLTTQLLERWRASDNTWQAVDARDDAATMPSLRTLGTGPLQAAAGNHQHDLTDAAIKGVAPDARLPMRLRGDLPSTTDANLAVLTGWYAVPHNASGIPVAEAGYLTVLSAGGLVHQTYRRAADADGVPTQMWTRFRTAGSVWGFWESATDLSNPAFTGTLPDARLSGRIGSSALGIGDWNNATLNGWYKSPPGAANVPPGVAWVLGSVEAHDTDWVTQTVHAFTEDSGFDATMWRRQKNAGVWSAWYRLRWSEAELDARYGAPESWQPLQRAAGVSIPTAANHPPPEFRRRGTRVTGRGVVLVDVGATSGIIGVLPAGYRPASAAGLSAVTFPASSPGWPNVAVQLTLKSSGELRFAANSNVGHISLDTLAFDTD